MDDRECRKDFRNDQLLQCLVFIAGTYRVPCSETQLMAGLPLVNHQLTPSLFVEAAARAGFTARIVERPLKKIPILLLPCTLLLQKNQCCVLIKKNDDELEIFFPDTGTTETWKEEEIEQLYTGFAIFIQYGKKDKSEISHLEKPSTRASWFWKNFWRYKAIHSEVLMASLLINIFTLISPLYVMNVYDRVIPNNSEVTLWVLSSGMAVIYLFDFILRVLRSYYLDTCNKKNDIVLVGLLFKRVLGMTMVNKPDSIGVFANNFREFDSLRDFFSSATLVAVIDLPFAILFLILTWYLGGSLVIVPLIAIIIVTISSRVMAKPIHNAVEKMTQSSAKKNAVLVESLLGLEVLKCMNAEGLLQKRWETHVGETAEANFRARFLSAILSSISYYTQQIVTIANLVVGFYLIYEGQMTVGAVIACNILSGRTVVPFVQLSNLMSRLQQSRQAMENLGEIAALPQERIAGFKHLPCNELQGNFQMNQISFRYPGQKQAVIQNLNIQIKKGEKVAIIGRIGSGKTTLLKLLLGLYSPEHGNILVDGLDIAQIEPADLRRQIGYVPQDSLLFNGSIRDNIALANPAASDKLIQEVSAVTGVNAFINHHPMGFNLPVGERGENLSGGQRQSIALARAFINNPPVLFLDEPTSAMDNSTEQAILKSIKEYARNKTIILTTHKFSMIPLIDRIIVFDNGKAVLDGPKDDVINALNKKAKPG